MSHSHQRSRTRRISSGRRQSPGTATNTADWRCGLELDAARRTPTNSGSEFAAAIRREADFRIYNEFRCNDHIGTTLPNPELIEELGPGPAEFDVEGRRFLIFGGLFRDDAGNPMDDNCPAFSRRISQLSVGDESWRVFNRAMPADVSRVPTPWCTWRTRWIQIGDETRTGRRLWRIFQISAKRFSNSQR